MRNLKSIIPILCFCLPVFIISCSNSVRDAGKAEQFFSNEIIKKYEASDKKPIWAIGRDIIFKLKSGEFADIEEYMNYLVARKPYTVDGTRVLEDLYPFVAERLYSRDMLDKWCAQETPHHSSFILRGIYYMNQAWKFKGTGFAYTVTAEDWRKFYEHLELAKKDLEKAYSMNPEDPNSSAVIIRVCMGLNNSEREMNKWFKRSIEADPVSYSAYATKQNFIRPKWGGSPQKDKAFAEDCYENAPPKSIVHEIMLDYIIENYKWTGNKINYYHDPSITKTIEAVAQKTLNKFSDSTLIRKKLAAIETIRGNKIKAIELYSEILAKDLGNPEALRSRALLYSPLLKKNDLAQADIKKSLESDPDGPNNYNELAKMALSSGERKKAIEYYTKAIARQPKAIQFYLARGLVKMKGLQNYAAALEDFREAEKMDTLLILTNFSIAICLEKMQRFEEAKNYCIKTLDIIEAKKPRQGTRSIPPAQAANYKNMTNALLAKLNMTLEQNGGENSGFYVPDVNSTKEMSLHEKDH